MRIEFKMDPNYVKFPIGEIGGKLETLDVPRPIGMPLKEIHGKKLLTIGHKADVNLLAYQTTDKPYKINYAYPVSEAVFKAIIYDLKHDLGDEEVISYILSHYAVVEESCAVYREDHNIVDQNLKYSS